MHLNLKNRHLKVGLRKDTNEFDLCKIKKHNTFSKFFFNFEKTNTTQISRPKLKKLEQKRGKDKRYRNSKTQKIK